MSSTAATAGTTATMARSKDDWKGANGWWSGGEDQWEGAKGWWGGMEICVEGAKGGGGVVQAYRLMCSQKLRLRARARQVY